MDACEAQGVEVPTWSSDGGFVTITFKRPFFKANTIETNGEDNRTSKQDNLRSTTAQVQKMILSMDESYMTMSKIMENMGFKHRTSFRENYFLPALEDGAIELLYPEQPNHPKQQYRLTEATKEWLNNNSVLSKSQKSTAGLNGFPTSEGKPAPARERRFEPLEVF